MEAQVAASATGVILTYAYHQEVGSSDVGPAIEGFWALVNPLVTERVPSDWAGFDLTISKVLAILDFFCIHSRKEGRMYNPHRWRNKELPGWLGNILRALEVSIPAVVAIIPWRFTDPNISMLGKSVPKDTVIGVACLLFLLVAAIRIIAGFFHNPQRPILATALDNLGGQFWNRRFVDANQPGWGNNITLYQLRRKRGWFWVWALLRRKETRHLVPRIRCPLSGARPNQTYTVSIGGGHCEGFPGRVFSSMKAESVSALPDVSPNANANKTTRKKYAKETGDSFKWVTENQPVARSMYGMPLLRPNGERWGVVIFRSKEENGIDEKIINPDPDDTRVQVFVQILQGHLNGK